MYVCIHTYIHKDLFEVVVGERQEQLDLQGIFALNHTNPPPLHLLLLLPHAPISAAVI